MYATIDVTRQQLRRPASGRLRQPWTTAIAVGVLLVEQRLGTRYTATEIVGQNISMLMLESRRGAHDQYLQNYLSGQVAKIIGSGRELPGRRKDGSVVPLELGVSEIAIAIAGRRP